MTSANECVFVKKQWVVFEIFDISNRYKAKMQQSENILKHMLQYSGAIVLHALPFDSDPRERKGSCKVLLADSLWSQGLLARAEGISLGQVNHISRAASALLIILERGKKIY